jgi:VPS62-like protein
MVDFDEKAETIGEALDALMAGLSKTDLVAAIAAYAPVVRYHPAERYMPSSVEWMLQHSWLCQTGGLALATADNLPSSLDAPDDHRFWLQAKDEAAKAGSIASAKAYVQAKPVPGQGATDISLWFCFPNNGPGTAHLFPIADTVPLSPIGTHGGDWEMVTLRIDNATKALRRVYLAQHAEGEWVDDLSRFARQNGRTVIYSSLNAHASYCATGDNPTERKTVPSPLGNLSDFYLINACAEGGRSLDCATSYQLVSATYLGSDAPVEPSWLNFGYRWGPIVEYPSGTIASLVAGLGPAGSWLRSAFPSELTGADGPRGPKTKSSWLGAPDA